MPKSFSRLTAWIGLCVLSSSLTLLTPLWCQELGSNVPPDQTLLMQRSQEGGTAGSGIFDVAVPPPGQKLRPVRRVPRNKFGIVGPFPLTLKDLDALVYPGLSAAEKERLLEGMSFFTTAHTPEEGAGPMANQPFCLGCHESTAEQVPQPGVVSAEACIPGSTCVSLVSRAARSTPTNFAVTSLDPKTGGGVPPGKTLPDGKPDPDASVDAINGPGRTAAFTIFNDFNPSVKDAGGNPGFQDPLDGSTMNIVNGKVSQPFGGFVQHVRPSLAVCVPKPIAPVEADANLGLTGSPDPVTGLFPSGFRRSVGERAGPPYIGRGLMEAIPTADIVGFADPDDSAGHNSKLKNFAPSLGCTGDCIAGEVNTIPRTLALHTDANGNLTSVTGFVGGVGRFGLRANGVEILQFSIGGLQGELSFTSLINGAEINFPTLFPAGGPPTQEPADCLAAASKTPEVHLSAPFSERNFIRNTAPPEFGGTLLKLLKSDNPAKPRAPHTQARQVQRGAELFGIDLVAFANRMMDGRMPDKGDGRDLHAINQKDRELNCVGCHIPVQRTGLSPTAATGDVGARHLSFRWAPIFSDLLLHKMPVIDAERFSQRPRDPFLVSRASSDGSTYETYDLTRNFADDVFSNAKATALGSQFRTAPLMGMGRMGAPFMHDARVYLSTFTVDTNPAGTVTSSRRFTNAPLVVRSLEDAIRAAIELHDLPAPDDNKTPNVAGAGCPVPPANTNVNYGQSPQNVICPAYDSEASKTNRSEAREVIRRFRNLTPEDQRALIEFLKQL